MFVVMNILNNHFLIGKQEEKQLSNPKTWEMGVKRKARSIFRELGFTSRFGNDINKFRTYLTSVACERGSGWKRAHDLSLASKEKLLSILNTKAYTFDTQEAAEYFLTQYPPFNIPLEYLIIIEQ